MTIEAPQAKKTDEKNIVGTKSNSQGNPAQGIQLVQRLFGLS